jgi:hypothetical protein
VQEDPIADAYCTVPAFRWKNMFYPELKMPYMPISKMLKEGITVAKGEDIASVELEELELAMVGFSLFRNVCPCLKLTRVHACAVAGNGGGREKNYEGG